MPKIGRTPRSHKSAPLLHPTPRKTRRIAVYSGSEVFRFSALSARGTGGRLSRDHSGVPGPQRFVRRKIVKNRWAFTILYVHLLYLRTKNIKTPINIITIGRAILYIYYYCYWTVITGVCRVFNKIQNPKNSDRNSLLAAHRSYRRLSYSSGAGWRRTKKKKEKEIRKITRDFPESVRLYRADEQILTTVRRCYDRIIRWRVYDYWQTNDIFWNG